MGLESATFINDLVSTNPLGTDLEAQGDDHLRLIKTVLQAQFKNASRAFYLPVSVAAQTSTYNVAAADQNKLVPIDCSSGAITVNLPAGSGLPDGYEMEVLKKDYTDFVVTITPNGADTINGDATQVLWQTYQSSRLMWCSTLSGWVGKRHYIPPKGEITPWGGSAALPPGYVWPNGTAIGDASSAAAQLASATAQGLFYHIWNNYANAQCAVSSGRGVSAAADWAAHKTIATPNLCGNTYVGLDNLGGASDAGRLNTGAGHANSDGHTNGELLGLDGVVMTTDGLPASGLSVTGNTGNDTPDHTHTTNAQAGTGNAWNQAFSAVPLAGSTASGGASTRHTHPISLTTGNMGAGNAHSNLQPSFVSGWKLKL